MLFGAKDYPHSVVLYLYPIKQGLKRLLLIASRQILSGSLSLSNKTRIETKHKTIILVNIRRVLYLYPIKQGLKPLRIIKGHISP